MVGAINQTGVFGPFGEALSTVDQALTDVSEHGKTVKETMAGVGAGMLGVGALLSGLGSKEQASHQRLQAAIKATGGAYSTYADQIEKTIKTGENYNQGSAETQDALTKLTLATHNPTEAVKLMSTAFNVAAATHTDLASAALQVGKAYDGNTRLFKQFGITATVVHGHLTDQKQAMAELADVTKGQASASVDTFSGKLDVLKTKIEDQVAQFGQKYGPAIQLVGVGFMALASLMEVGSALMAAAESIAFAPLLLGVLALAAVGVAAYELYKNWKTVWDAIKDVAKAVWDWISNNWPYLLGVLTGPFGIAAALIYKNFDTIKSWALDAVNGVETVWGDITRFFTRLVDDVGKVIADIWKPISDGATAVVGIVEAIWNGLVKWVGGIPGDIWTAVSGLWAFVSHELSAVNTDIQSTWTSIIGWVTGLPGKIAVAASGMWHGITDAFKAAINDLIDLWNKLHFKLPKINIGPIHIGGEEIGVPAIPHLAQGGLITQTGLIYAHAGEAITPAPQVGRGPIIHIENVNSNVDVDLLAQRVSGLLLAGRL
jgi:phage-related protein